MTVGGLYLLGLLAAIAVLYLAFKFAAWEEWDDSRRRERKVHRNLLSQTGRWTT